MYNWTIYEIIPCIVLGKTCKIFQGGKIIRPKLLVVDLVIENKLVSERDIKLVLLL